MDVIFDVISVAELTFGVCNIYPEFKIGVLGEGIDDRNAISYNMDF